MNSSESQHTVENPVNMNNRAISMHPEQRTNYENTKIFTDFASKMEKFGIADIKSIPTFHNIMDVFKSTQNNPSITATVKNELKQEFVAHLERIANLTPENIKAFAAQRNEACGGIEGQLLARSTPAEKNAYYLGKILERTAGEYLNRVNLSIQYALAPTTNGVNTELLVRRSDWFKILNKRYGINITLPSIASNETNALHNADFRIIQAEILKIAIASGEIAEKDKPYLQGFINNPENSTKRIRFNDMMRYNGVPLSDIVSEYRATFGQWYGAESTAQITRDEITRNGIDNASKRGIRTVLDQGVLPNEVAVLAIFTERTTSLDNRNLADLMIDARSLSNQLKEMMPVSGNVVTLLNSFDTMSLNGEVSPMAKRVLGGIFAALGIVATPAQFSKLIKMGKIPQIINNLNKLVRAIELKLVTFVEKGGKITKETLDLLGIFGKIVGRSVGEAVVLQIERFNGQFAYNIVEHSGGTTMQAGNTIARTRSFQEMERLKKRVNQYAQYLSGKSFISDATRDQYFSPDAKFRDISITLETARHNHHKTFNDLSSIFHDLCKPDSIRDIVENTPDGKLPSNEELLHLIYGKLPADLIKQYFEELNIYNYLSKNQL